MLPGRGVSGMLSYTNARRLILIYRCAATPFRLSRRFSHESIYEFTHQVPLAIGTLVAVVLIVHLQKS